MIKKKNYKLVLGVIVGVLISASVVGAATYYGAANTLSYNNSNSDLSSSNVQDALDELYNRTYCPADTYCEPYKTTLAVGDYVSYTPSKTSYTTDTSMTGYTSTQTINPSELNLWRVLNVNSDGTVDLISEYVSSTNVYFRGQTGYLNLVGYLNTLAEQYETDGITAGSRYFGYNGQTEFLDPDNVDFTQAPWTSSTGSSTVESQGGGDTLYTTDYNQLFTALGTRLAYKVGTSTATAYCMASRYYYYSSSSSYRWIGRSVNSSGSYGNGSLYGYYNGSFYTNDISYALRPIVTLRSTLQVEGIGTVYAPMKIITS